MINIKSQRGASYWSIMFGLLLAVVMIKAVLVIGPAYMDNRLINTTVEERLKVTTDTNPSQFIQSLDSQFNMNNLRDVQAKDVMTATSDASGLQVQVDYEVRKNFIANVDLVVAFKKQFDQRAVKAGTQ